MSVMLAIAHIVGAAIAAQLFGIAVLTIWVWQRKRNLESACQEMSIALDIPMDRMDDPDFSRRIVQYAATRFSSESIRNRLSDLCGWIQTVWEWLGVLTQIGVLIGVIWYSITNSSSNAVYAWWVLAVALSFWLSSEVFAYTCKFMTGRFPGEARQARKNIGEFVRNRSAVSAQVDNG
jgi:hypothetical protein